MWDVIVIGGGPAGLTAALYAARGGLKTLVLEGGTPGGQMGTTPEIENYPGTGTVSGFELAMKMMEQAQQAGAEMMFEQAEELETAGPVKRVRTATQELEARALILATGASRRKLGIPGEEEFAGRGVSYCAVCDGNFFRGKEVAVIGGGNTALEDAEYLATLCQKVYLIHRREEFRGGEVLAKRVRSKENVELVLSSVAEEVLGTQAVEGLRVRHVVSGDVRELKVSGVFVAVGTLPNSALAEGKLPLAQGGAVAYGAGCRTEVEGVFVAGDVADTPLRQIVTACADGALAAASAMEYCR